MSGPIHLLVLLYLLVDLLVGLLAPLALLGVGLGGAPAEAAHDWADGRRPDAAARRMLLLLWAIRRRTRRIGDAPRLPSELRLAPLRLSLAKTTTTTSAQRCNAMMV